MGNWRTVTIEGTCPAGEVAALRDALDLTDIMREGVEWLPLCFGGGIGGLGDWAAETISAGGNLFERDYSVEDVADHLRKLHAVAPGLRVKVHCGDDWEATNCIATVTLDGAATIGPAEVASVAGVSDEEAQARLMKALLRP